MKLTILLLLISAPFILCSTQYTVLGDIGRYTKVKFKPKAEGNYCAFGFDVRSFQPGTGFYFEMSITNGVFEHGTMNIGSSLYQYTPGTQMSLSTPILNYFIDSKNKELKFFVYKDSNNYNYLYIAPPPAQSSTLKETTEIVVINTEGPIYYLLGDITRYGSYTFTPTEKGLFGLLRLDTYNFKNKKDGYFFQMVMSASGTFSSNRLNYGTSDEKFPVGQQITLQNHVDSTSPYYNLLAFTVPKFTHRYLYIAPPPPAYNFYKSQYQVTIYNTPNRFGQDFKVMGEIDRNSNETIIPSNDGEFCAYYLKLDSKDTKLYFDAKITNGEFEHEYMYYMGFKEKVDKGNKIVLDNYVGRDLAGTTFTISKPQSDYLFIASPKPLKFTSNTVITISNTNSSNSNKVAIGVGVGVACAVIIAVIIIIVVVKNKNESVESSEIDTKNEPIHLGASHY